MIFTDNHNVEDELEVVASEEVDWLSWAREHNFISAGYG
jgi:hypothetical protein